MRGIHQTQRPVMRSFDYSLMCAWKNGCANSWYAGDLRCHGAHCDITVMRFDRHLDIGSSAAEIWLKQLCELFIRSILQGKWNPAFLEYATVTCAYLHVHVSLFVHVPKSFAHFELSTKPGVPWNIILNEIEMNLLCLGQWAGLSPYLQWNVHTRTWLM